MKISIENFKSIRQVCEFEIKPMTILSGVNSSGKSSLIQFILLLKQTLADSSTSNVLSIDSHSFKIQTYGQNADNLISFQLSLNKSEIEIPTNFAGAQSVLIELSYKLVENQVEIAKFSTKIYTDKDEAKWFIILNLKNDGNYNIKVSNPSIFVQEDVVEKEGSVDFVAMIPQIVTDEEGQKFPFKLDWVNNAVSKIFELIYYVGPVRQQPEESYQKNNASNYVGSKGEMTAQILKEHESKEVVYFPLNNKEQKNDTLLNVVNYWLCKEFGIGGKIFSEKGDEIYRIILEDDTGLKVNIKHVGYGISQVLPIIVQGLLMPENGILIIEQPEIHLHPKIQSLLYDFLYSLTLSNKKVIVETHSNHFVTRMRRRIAEDESSQMDDKINMTFIEYGLFRHLEFDDYGTMLHYYPKDFIEVPSEEMRAIIQAQSKKRRKNG